MKMQWSATKVVIQWLFLFFVGYILKRLLDLKVDKIMADKKIDVNTFDSALIFLSNHIHDGIMILFFLIGLYYAVKYLIKYVNDKIEVVRNEYEQKMLDIDFAILWNYYFMLHEQELRKSNPNHGIPEKRLYEFFSKEEWEFMNNHKPKFFLEKKLK